MNDYIGYLKYSGKLVDEGLLDAKKAADALIGFDGALRYFIIKECPQLEKVSFEIPVRIQKGSWEALIPTTIEQWIRAALGIAGTTYLTTAAKKISENDFKDVSFKNIFKKSLEGIQWIVKIGIHVGELPHKKFNNVKFSNNNTEIGIPNSRKEYLYVPKKYIDFYTSCPPKLLSKLTKLITEDRKMVIGVIDNGAKKEVTVSINEKYIFTTEEDTEEFLFPELKHGQQVELEGEITRGNEITNSIGLQYKEKILSCHPTEGNIAEYKNFLFIKCKVIGTIDRTNDIGIVCAKKPKIIFNKIVSLGNKNNEPTLF